MQSSSTKHVAAWRSTVLSLFLQLVFPAFEASLVLAQRTFPERNIPERNIPERNFPESGLA
jgi:hypothetical protein